jgi:endonuclease/exonuclease/phosphatase family metal-dependent hydrolase
MKVLFIRLWPVITLCIAPFLFFTMPSAQPEPSELRIMTFNIWLGGELVNFGKVVEAIEGSSADIVGLQEATGNTRRLADALGWYANERMQIISRFPLIDPPGGDGNYIFAQLNPGEVVAVANVHLPSDPYGPYLVRDGATLGEVLENEQATRMPMLEPVLEKLAELSQTGMPILLTGDFNSPSHLDWIDGLSEAREEVKYLVPWPVTVAVEAAGFIDTYRAARPDPVAEPGVTWTYGYPYPRLESGEVLDRIDLVFATNNIEVVSSEIVGPGGSPNADIEITPYPSDHRGVVSTVRVTPVEPPVFVATDKRKAVQGEPIVVRYHAPNGEDTDRIVLVKAEGDALNDALMSLPPYEADFFGAVTFGSQTLEPGLYDAVLLSENTEEVSRTSFWIVDANALPSLSTDKTSYSEGEAITVSWGNAPAQRWDWLGIYAADDADLYNYLGFLYTNSSVSGSTIFDSDVLGETMLPPGEYEMRLMLDDGYQVLGSSRFTIEPTVPNSQ